MILFGIISLLTLTGVFCKTSSSENKTWWRYTEIYEIFIWSFKDSNGDGIGDINGITSMLDHFVDLNVETLWVSPYFQSPMHDMGYDISHFTDIDPKFGTMADFDELIAEMKKRNMKLLMDLVINHSSDKHQWFNASVYRKEPYTDFYIWKDPKGYSLGKPIPPNNWVSLFGGSAWEWNDIRKQFYLHQFSKHQVELNLRNKEVKKTIKGILKYWLDRGIAGFRLDATRFYMEDKLFRNDIPIVNKDINKERIDNIYYEDYDHIYTADLIESYEFIHELREYVDKNYNHANDIERILVAEAYTKDEYLSEYYGNLTYPITHYPFNFNLLLYSFPNAHTLDDKVKNWYKLMPPGNVASWVAENHDNYRVGSRLNEQYMDIIVALIMMLPGVACFYYGQEIGMVDNDVRPDQKRDGFINKHRPGRDAERLPMQWDDSLNGGFTTKHKPWLPIHPNYWRVNVETEKNTKNSRYNLFKKLSKLRRTETSKKGELKTYILSKWSYAIVRTHKGHPTYITVFNLGTETEYIDLHMTVFHIPPVLTVVTASLNAGFSTGDKFLTKPKIPQNIVMRPISCVIFTTGSVDNYLS